MLVSVFLLIRVSWFTGFRFFFKEGLFLESFASVGQLVGFPCHKIFVQNLLGVVLGGQFEVSFFRH